MLLPGVALLLNIPLQSVNLPTTLKFKHRLAQSVDAGMRIDCSQVIVCTILAVMSSTV
jgi:hypothetical protein